MDLKQYIADVKDFPEQGIIFRDISPLMANGEAYRYSIKEIVKYAQDLNVDKVVGPEARGFMVGCPVAVELGCGFAMARKKANCRAKQWKYPTGWNTEKQRCNCIRMLSCLVTKCWYAMICWPLAGL